MCNMKYWTTFAFCKLTANRSRVYRWNDCIHKNRCSHVIFFFFLSSKFYCGRKCNITCRYDKVDKIFSFFPCAVLDRMLQNWNLERFNSINESYSNKSRSHCGVCFSKKSNTKKNTSNKRRKKSRKLSVFKHVYFRYFFSGLLLKCGLFIFPTDVMKHFIGFSIWSNWFLS